MFPSPLGVMELKAGGIFMPDSPTLDRFPSPLGVMELKATWKQTANTVTL